MVGRQSNRVRLILERRKLSRFETALGLLGWQQADYDSATQQQVNRLMDCEREQARITNDSAAIGLEIQQLEKRRGTAEREFAEAVSAALEKEHPTAVTIDALEAKVEATRRDRREIEARLPVLDRELRDAEEQYRALIVPDLPPPEVQTQLLKWRKRIMALPREKSEWVGKLHEVAGELDAMEKLLEALTEARTQFEKRDEELADEISAQQKSKRKVEKQIDGLEKAKSDPYREIGRTLADQNIGPLNQPEALTAVLAQRKKIGRIEAAIDASLAVSESGGGRGS